MGKKEFHSDTGLNRGPWTPTEDLLLRKYIEAHGEGNWRNIPIKAGLLRCGRSCRLRWMNYLRPDVKRGHITPEEEELIIRLHKLLGNRWSLIAGRMPGRTDNEIKNYWNTHLSKKRHNHKRPLEPSHDNEECTPPKKSVIVKKNIRDNDHVGSADKPSQSGLHSGNPPYLDIERFLMETEDSSIPTDIYYTDLCTDWGRYANCRQMNYMANNTVYNIAGIHPILLSTLSSGLNFSSQPTYSTDSNSNARMTYPITDCSQVENLWTMLNNNNPQPLLLTEDFGDDDRF